MLIFCTNFAPSKRKNGLQQKHKAILLVTYYSIFIRFTAPRNDVEMLF